MEAEIHVCRLQILQFEVHAETKHETNLTNYFIRKNYPRENQLRKQQQKSKLQYKQYFKTTKKNLNFQNLNKKLKLSKP